LHEYFLRDPLAYSLRVTRVFECCDSDVHPPRYVRGKLHERIRYTRRYSLAIPTANWSTVRFREISELESMDHTSTILVASRILAGVADMQDRPP
jgi:hypothetical protein